ncbi:leucine-rich repeat protein [Mycoplasma sp. 332]|uniref:leucine-rich repeat protein n=1 Tax=Mycoplasma sp. 332 TaxID=3458236 RepID=UPI0040362F6D
MKIAKKILLTLTSISVPCISTALVVSCSRGESLNDFAKAFVLGTAGRENYKKDTKTLDLSKTNLKVIPAGAFSGNSLHGLFLNTNEQSHAAPEFLAAPGIFDIKKNEINIEKIILPSSLEIIEKGAFANLGLKEIQFDISSNNLTKIEDEAFANNRLTKVELPSSIAEINEKAFYNNQITSINIEAAARLKKLSFGVLAKNKLTQINLKNINTIEDSALALNEFAMLNLPKNVTRVSEKMFFFFGKNSDAHSVELTIENDTVKKQLTNALKENNDLHYSIK